MSTITIKNKIKVLIIDDNRSITSGLEKFFKFHGFDCVVVNDGNNGLELIRNGNYDAVLLDLAMPGFSGLDVLNTLAKENKTSDKKIIVLTASPIDNVEEEKLKKLGVNSIQRKPMDVNALIEIIK